MSPAATLRRRRVDARHAEQARTRQAIARTAAELRGHAIVLTASGRRDLAQPYLDEAQVLAEAAGDPARTL